MTSELPKILYVDDESINLELFEVMYDDDYNVLTATSGFQGLEVLQKESDIKLVISDMKMPGMNGLEFISAIKKEMPDMPCLMLSGYELPEEVRLAIDEGTIGGYMRKPFDNEEMTTLIERYIAK